ncbi:MAG: S8/S53 family peptidase [Deltaproteobacteria bacterium]|nr:S8/S53 family peptidase [Deltaproteobacteria bacterium]
MNLDDVAYFQPDILSMSIEYAGLDPLCKGEDSLSRDANDLYELGIPVFAAAGNDCHYVGQCNENFYYTDTHDCVVDSPASAMGVFTVGAHGEYLKGEEGVRIGDIAEYSSRGGTTTEGKGRTIIDITASGCRDYHMDINDNYYYDPEHYQCGTSFATPTVAAGAAMILDWYSFYWSSLLVNPGRLYSFLLLMGDRAQEPFPENQPDSDFDPVFGAGRFKMRRLDTYGGDTFWAKNIMSTCIDDAETAYIYIYNGYPLPAGVDVFKAVMFYYDYRHENGTAIDNINMKLQEKINLGGIYRWVTVGGTREVDPGEEKERVFLSGNLEGRMFRLAVTGADVTSSNAGCGNDSMMVNISFFFEDSARDDYLSGGIGPNDDINPE